jgi:hypothetical protein
MRLPTILPALFLGLLPGPAAQGAPTELRLEPVTVRIQHARGDLDVEAVWMQFYCLRTDGPAVSLAECGEVQVDDQPQDSLLALPGIGGNQVRTPPILVRFTHPQGRILCIGMKALFTGYSNQQDHVLYKHADDRYSILSYCTADVLPPQHAEQPRWAHRRAATFEEFQQRLAWPLPLELRPKAP